MPVKNNRIPFKNVISSHEARAYFVTQKFLSRFAGSDSVTPNEDSNATFFLSFHIRQLKRKQHMKVSKGKPKNGTFFQ